MNKENNVCEKCGEIHKFCKAHRNRNNVPDAKLHPCNRRPKKGTMVCRVHGGNSLKGAESPTYKTGLRSNFFPDRIASRFGEFEQSISDGDLLTIRKQIRSTLVRISFLEERVETGDSLKSWQEVRRARKDLGKAKTEEEREKTLIVLDKAIKTGLNDYRSWDELTKMQIHLNKLVTSERKKMIEDKFMLSINEAVLLFGALSKAIREEVKDEVLLRNLRKKLHTIAEQAGLT